MVTVGTMQNNVGFRCFSGEQLSTVQVTIDQADLGVLRSNLCTFVAIADECCDLKIRVSVCNSVESIASDVSCGTCAEKT